MKAKWSPVSETYLGNSLGNSQDPDEPGDQLAGPSWEKISGRGSRGGGSKPTHQAQQMKKGSATIGSSRPKGTQRIRG